MKRLVVALLLAVAVSAASAGVAAGAAPRIVIVSGKPLTHQVGISDSARIFIIVDGLSGARPVPRTQLANRPGQMFSMFWGPRCASAYLSSGEPPRRCGRRPARSAALSGVARTTGDDRPTVGGGVAAFGIREGSRHSEKARRSDQARIERGSASLRHGVAPLNVDTPNDAARSLYDELGFVDARPHTARRDRSPPHVKRAGAALCQ